MKKTITAESNWGLFSDGCVPFLLGISLSFILLLPGCGSSSSSTASSPSISGTVQWGSTVSSTASTDGSCSDGRDSATWRVSCVPLSLPVGTAVSATLQCSTSNNQGTFTLSSLTQNQSYTCLLQRSTDKGSHWSTVASLPWKNKGLPAGLSYWVALNGPTTAAWTLDELSRVSVSISKDNRNVPLYLAPSLLVPFVYNWSCLSSSDADSGTNTQQTQCNCLIGDWATAGYGSLSACIADSGKAFTSTVQKQVDLQLYKATAPYVALSNDSGTSVLGVGEIVQVMTLWNASSGTSLRGSSGGEGFVSDPTNLKWDNTVATKTIAWANGTVTYQGVQITLNTNSNNSFPSPGASPSTWSTFNTQLISNSNWTGCTWESGATTASTASTKPGCHAQFLQNLFTKTPGSSDGIYPRITLDWTCPAGICDSNLNRSKLFILGQPFGYSSLWSSTSTMDSVVISKANLGPTPHQRPLAGQFYTYSSDNRGGAKTSDLYVLQYSCGASGKDVTDANCTGSQDHIRCMMRKEYGAYITANGSDYKAIVEDRNLLAFGEYVSTNSAINGKTALTLCATATQTFTTDAIFGISAKLYGQ